jgi:amino acid adenylation domain-containing protein
LAQEQVLSLARRVPHASFNVTAGVRLKGPLDTAVLRRILNELVERHEALRTTIYFADSAAGLILMRHAEVTLAVQDYVCIDAEQKKAYVHAASMMEANCSFDLASAPLMRATLLKLEAEEHVFFLTMHSLITDLWSMGILLREAGSLYRAFVRQQQSPLPPLELQYADYADWQRECLQSGLLEDELFYWLSGLRGALALRFPTDAPQESVVGYPASHLSFEFDHRLAAEVTAFSRRERLTVFMVMLAALYVILRRKYSLDDIVIMSPLAGRTRPELENIVGLFENTVALRVELLDTLSFREALSRVREVCIGAYRHQELPFEIVLQSLPGTAQPGEQALGRFWFALEDVFDPEAWSSEIQGSNFLRQAGVTRFEQSWKIHLRPDGIAVTITYGTELLGSDTITCMATEYRELLQEMLANPDEMIAARAFSRPTETSDAKPRGEELPLAAVTAHVVRKFEPPQTGTEKTLAALWAEVLNVDMIGRHDNFFELGGHSLLAVVLMQRMQAAGFNVDVATIFAAPSIARLSVVVTPGNKIADALPSRIPAQCTHIQPEMLSLVELTSEEITRIVNDIPGGAQNVEDIYPLMPSQEGILFHHLLPQAADPYVLSVALSFDNRERLDAYVSALQAVIGRNDILRTAILWEGVSQPVQVVLRNVMLTVDEVLLDEKLGHPATQLETRSGLQKIDLRVPPALRVYVAQDKNTGQWFMIQMLHHIAGDFGTVELIRQEISTYLAAKAEILPPPIRFRSLVADARLHVNREDDDAYFRTLLGDIDEPTCPFGLTDVHGDGTLIQDGTLALEGELARHVRDICRSLEVSAASLFHAAWAVLLARTSGKSDVVFGTVILAQLEAGNERQRVMGPCINTLPVRIRVGGCTAAEAVRQIQLQLANLIKRQHFPLARAQSCSGVIPPAPLFSALFNYRHHFTSKWSAQDSETVWQGINYLYGRERTNYPVTLSVEDMGAGFTLTAQVHQTIGAPRLLAIMRQAVQSLVDSLENTPRQQLCQLKVITDCERTRAVHGFNTRASFPSQTCIHQMFEEQACRRPDAVAIVFEDAVLTYAVLNSRATRLAHYLISHGVAAETRVALCLRRGLDMLIWIVAVLKAGGAYVPIDPDYPSERLAFIAEDCDAAVLITEADLKDRLANFRGQVITLDDDLSKIEGKDGEQLACETGAENLAYVIYTSGSTGNPKGCEITHANIVRLLAATNDCFRFNQNDVWTMFHSYAFDFSVWELWGALAYGGKLIIVPSLITRSADELYRLLQTERVTVFNQTPSAFFHLMNAARQVTGLPSPFALRYLIFGGEVLELSKLKAWLETQGEQVMQMANLYGITETTVHVTYMPLSRTDLDRAVNVIGRPIPDLQVYILDHDLEPVPIGVVGEMYVAGAGVARGYLNRPALTAQRFLPDPFGSKTGARLYRTGDLARLLPSGDLEFLGRNDFQVKIRGFRVELGEIEERLLQHNQLQGAVVVVREDRPGEKRLVAYYTMRENCHLPLDPSSLRAFMAEKLPDYMVPSAYVMLKSLPMTAHGKTDRRSLPRPQIDAYPTAREGPGSAMEEMLCIIWKDLLNIDKVGIEQNFFTLGGHSLLATQVLSRMRLAFHVDLTLRDLYERPTVRAIADRILELQIKSTNPTVVDQLVAKVKEPSSQQSARLESTSM